jgi:hypothetical protein
MLIEHLIPHGFITQLHSPPQLLLERSLKEIYLVVSDRFHYTQFELLPSGQGALLKDGEQRACEIYSDRIVIKEQPTQQNFDEFIDQVLPMVSEIKQRTGHPLWIFQQVVLRYLLPFETPVMPMLQEHLFAIDETDLEKFGRPVLGLCLRIEFPPLPEDPTQVQLRIEPFFREPRMLFLELSTRFLQPIQQPGELATRLRSSYEFLKDKSLTFLQQVFSREQG